MKNNNKKSIILSVIVIAMLAILVIGATYAYFTAQGGNATSAKLNVTTYTTDVFTFTTGDDINIYADQSTFASGKGNATGSTFARASLTANNKTNTATEHYNVYFNISDNNFKYSVNSNTPELLLTIKDANNNEVTSISGLEHKTVTDGKGTQVSGFDITTKTGLLTLIDNREITASPSKVETWNITITFVNYNSDQSSNMGKTFDGQVLISKDSFSEYTPNTINSVTATKSGSNLTVKLNMDNGTNEIDKYYFAITEKDSVAMLDTNVMKLSNKLAATAPTYVESTTNSYTFASVKDNANYEISAYAVDKKKIKSNIYKYDLTTDNYNYPVINSVTTTSTSNSITVNVTATKGANNISKYYYSIDNGNSYIESTGNSYTFTELTSGNYRIIVKVSDTNNKYSNIYVVNEKTAASITLADYVKSLYTGTQGENGIYYHDSSLTNGAGDSSYRYSGANPNNYVCFGSDASTCPEDNLYRIIGVFNGRIKLIKATIATSSLLGTDGNYVSDGPLAYDTLFSWSSLSSCPSDATPYIKNENVTKVSKKNTLAVEIGPGEPTGVQSCNEWKYSELNTINLNTNYLNNIGTTWSNMIENTTWKISGHTTSSVTPSTMFAAEITNATKTYGPMDGTSKIGLMYVSDYGFAADPSAWTTNLRSYNNSLITKVNWLYLNIDYTSEGTLTKKLSESESVFTVTYGSIDETTANGGLVVRPVFFLKSSANYVSGSGNQSDPIIIN